MSLSLKLSVFRHLRTGLLTVLLAGLLGHHAAHAALPPGYQFKPLGETIGISAFKDSYDNRVLGVASALNNNGFIFGFWLTNEGVFHTHSLLFAANPQMTVRDTTDFIGLSGSDVGCRFFLGISLCSIEFPYGTRVVPSTVAGTPPTSISAFVHTPAGSVAIADSLPYMRYPGNFVNENAAGVLASTQLNATTQFGVIGYEKNVSVVQDGKTVTVREFRQIPLSDVPWLVAINDLAQPFVLAYDGSDGGCFVYGDSCVPAPTPCEATDPNQGNGGGRGNESSGTAWGHNKCKDGVVDGNNGGGSGGGGSGGTGTDPTKGAMLIRLLSDDSTLRFRFPATTPIGISLAKVTNAFPLAINNTRAILRGDITQGTTVYEKRLLDCVINPDAIDGNADGIVDCTGGMQVIGGLANSVRVGTVLGFSLNNGNLLAGNLGYNAAGTGMPFVLDVAAATPSAQIINNIATSTDAWEINTITDMNNAGRMTGYGFKNCAVTPEAFFIDPIGAAPASPLRFLRGAFEFPALLPVGNRLPITPTISGGSGFYEMRVHVKTPRDADWQLLSEWTVGGGLYDPGTYTGDVCFKIEARDVLEPDATQRTVVRYSVGQPGNAENNPDDNTGTGGLTLSQQQFNIGELLAVSNSTWLLMLVITGLMRGRNLRHRR